MRAALALVVLAACGNHDSPLSNQQPVASKPQPGSGSAQPPHRSVKQIPPPPELKEPPADATKTASGLVYRKIVVNEAGVKPQQNDNVLMNYTGWKQASGETFFTTQTQGQPNSLSLATTAPGFTEAVEQMHKGEKMLAWIPPSLTTGGTAKSKGDTLVYELEVLDVTSAPAIPADVAAAPKDAKTLDPAGVKYEIVKPGDGKTKPRAWDTVTFQITGWEVSGKMFDTTEMRKRPAVAPPFKESQLLERVMTAMTAGERVRFWTDAEQMKIDGRPPPGLPKGALCYELELISVSKAPADPAPVPADIAKPPDDAKKTDKGVFYKVLKAGTGEHPKPTDVVKMQFTGWHTDGRMFDSTLIRGQPQLMNVSLLPGWAEVLPKLQIGDHALVWIPEELAYKNAPNKPQGMLVFDLELMDAKAK